MLESHVSTLLVVGTKLAALTIFLMKLVDV
jgi:hypothetical protein